MTGAASMTRADALALPNTEPAVNGRCVGQLQAGTMGTALVYVWHDPAGCEHAPDGMSRCTVPAPALRVGDVIIRIGDGLAFGDRPLRVLNIGAASVRHEVSDVSVATDRGHTWLDRTLEVDVYRPACAL